MRHRGALSNFIPVARAREALSPADAVFAQVSYAPLLDVQRHGRRARPAQCSPASQRENLPFLSSRRGGFAARPFFILHRSEPLALVLLVEKEKAVAEPVAVAAPMLLVVQREAVDAFNEWSVRYLAMPEEERGKILDEGITLASARRTVMRGLIERDPRAALAKAVPPAVRQELPRAVVDRIEERVNERAFFGVLGVLAADGPASRREVRTEDGGRYRAFVYGAKLAQQTTEHASIVGIAVDDVIAVDERRQPRPAGFGA